MCFADFSVLVYFDFSIFTKIDPHKIIKTSPSAQKKKMAEFPYTKIIPHKN